MENNDYVITKRLPFGFVGDWGKLYKKYIANVEDSMNLVTYQSAYYRDIGQDIQCKRAYAYEIDGSLSKFKTTFVADDKNTYIKTTDSYWDNNLKEYNSIISINDIVFVFNRWWIVELITDKAIFTPARQSIYFFKIKEIDGIQKHANKIKGVNNG